MVDARPAGAKRHERSDLYTGTEISFRAAQRLASNAESPGADNSERRRKKGICRNRQFSNPNSASIYHQYAKSLFADDQQSDEGKQSAA